MIRRLDSALLISLAAVATVASSAWLAPGTAHACGGFFCNASTPVNQAAERIIFARAPSGAVTAVIQIQYTGPAERFAWMLPVAGSPEVAVSSNTAFQLLQSATNPSYLLTTTVEGSCRDDFLSGPSGSFADAGAVSFDAGPRRDDVTVVNQGSVGPYDFVVIAVDPAATDPAAIAVSWLRDNSYDVSDFGADRLSPYLMGGMNLLAFRLTKGNDTGSIRPVMLSFGNGAPSIPIRPTAVAASDDMGVMVWVLGDHRAVPVNYMSLELNEALINWINPSSNYNAVVTRAANEAGGQGFVTEMAGSSAPLVDTIFGGFMSAEWERIQTQDWTGREGMLLFDVLNTFGSYDGISDAIAATLPLPAGVTLAELLACPACYVDYSVTDIEGFEPADFLAAVTAQVIEPMERTRDLFSTSPYVTRLYTTMSADEMTRDPVFDFNPDLSDVSNQHNADRVIECSPSITQQQAPWRVHLPNGEVVRGRGTSWPFDASAGELPANARVVRVGTTGTGEVVEDNSAAIAEGLALHNDTIPRPRDPSERSWLCAASPGADAGDAGLGMLGLLVIGLLVAVRRRRG